MESFAAVVRTLLDRIRAIQDATPLPEPPAAPRRSLYRVEPATWGVVDHHGPRAGRPAPADRAPRPAERAEADARRGLELTVYGLPAPRGLVT